MCCFGNGLCILWEIFTDVCKKKISVSETSVNLAEFFFFQLGLCKHLHTTEKTLNDRKRSKNQNKLSGASVFFCKRNLLLMKGMKLDRELATLILDKYVN